MADVLDFSGLTLNPLEATEASQAVFEAVYAKPELEAAHDVRTGIQMKTQIPILGLLGINGKVSSGCTPNAGGVIPMTQKYWDPALIDFRLTHCQGDIPQLAKLWGRGSRGLSTWEDINPELLAFIGSRAVDASMEAILRLTSFGDTAASLASVGGLITAGVDVAYFTPLSGLWKQIYAAVAAGTIPAAQHIAISENAEASYAAQMALGTTTALDTFRQLYEAADPRVWGADVKPVLEITKSLFDNWQALLEDKSLVFSLDRTEQGATKWSYRGIPIVVRYDWDRNIKAYEDNATTYNKPHRAILTTLGNIPVGTSDDGSMKEFDSFYDKTTKLWYMDVAFYLDIKLMEESMITVAY